MADTPPTNASPLEPAESQGGQSAIDLTAGGNLAIGGDVVGRDKIVGYTAEQISALLQQISATFQPKPFDGRCPYRGLEAFGEEDAETFFGREKLVDEIVARVGQSRFVVIAGPSGSGKSSLVRAGLIHALRQGALPKSDRWRYETLTPGRHPLNALARVASSLAGTLNAGQDIRTKGPTDALLLHQWAEAALGEGRNRRAIIFVDQFEETFTQVAKESERAAFLNLLTHAATVEGGRVTVLFALRSDFVSDCATYPRLNALLNQQFLQVGAMQADELVSAIARPALQVGLRIDPDLIAQIINDLQDEPGALPLMQFALKDLFDSQQAAGGVIALTLDGYLARGGLHKSLERHADAAFAQLRAEEQGLARDIFTGLVEIGRGAQDTRRTAAFEELVPAGADPAQVEAVLGRLADARLITTDEREEAGVRARTATIAHERLIDAWPWLKRLVNENREAIALQNQIAEDAQEWERSGRDSSYMYVGARLAAAREQMGAKKLVLSGLAQAFVEASIEAREAARRAEAARQQAELEKERQNAARLRARNRLITAVGALALTAALFACLFGIAAVIFGFRSNANARQAQANLARADSLRLAAEANVILQSPAGNAETAALLAIRSLRSAYSLQADATLGKASSRIPYARKQFIGHSDSVLSVALSADGKYVLTGSFDKTARLWDAATGQEVRIFTGHINGVLSVAFSADGKYVLTGSFDKTARLWDAATGQEVHVFSGHTDAVYSVAFSPDGKYVLTGSSDKTARLWDAATGQEVRVFTSHADAVLGVAFSPDGKHILTGSRDATARLWDAATGQEVRVFSGHSGAVAGVAFSSNGQYVLTGSWSGTARLWDAATAQTIRVFTGQAQAVWSVTFSPDGKYVLAGSLDKTARLWDAATGQTVRIFTGHTDDVRSVTFSPDGKYVLTGSQDSTARLWDAATRQEAHAFTGHTSSVSSVAFSPDGKYALTGSLDKTAQLWDPATGQEVRVFSGHTDDVRSVAFSPDGKHILTGSADTTARLWDAATGQEVRVFSGHTGIVQSVAFSLNGKYVLTGSQDKTAWLWDAVTAQKVRVFTGHTGSVSSVAFSPDGQHVLTGSLDKTARLWGAATGQEVRVFTGHTDAVLSVTFSPDGQYVLTGGFDATARLWDAASGQEVRVFIGHTDWVKSVASSPDGQYVLTGSVDATARLWDAASGREVRVFTGHTASVSSVAFSPDGKYVLTGSDDKTARLWDADYRDLIRWVCARLVRDLTDEEREQYGITDKRATCEGE